MALATLFIPYSFYFGLYDIYYKTDTKLDDLESSEAQKLLIKWILKNILIIAYFFPGLPLRWFINETTLLKYGSAGIALTTVWIPCVKNSPTLTILLMILHVICFVVGPFNTFRNFLRGGYRQYRGSTLVHGRNLLKIGSIGVALTTVSIPCVKDSANLLIPLVLIHAFCFVIGPLHYYIQYIREYIQRFHREPNDNDLFIFSCFFWLLTGNGIVKHFIKARVPDKLILMDHLSYMLVPQTPLDFAKVESGLAIMLFVLTMIPERVHVEKEMLIIVCIFLYGLAYVVYSCVCYSCI
ncbi:hypothetical protein GCK72_002861 [Caenorhabditis remanei]|uniref:Uncharacterized protein n=1 Tax=Caenorhabditis remanei TaxID=31234 RepID=A0A6A5HX66_CAERE|nr:hypothetical protein GCK72_002861 [Caenorhabditis remanei]KAF1771037.1 hypothetical protein GCK72_002861 [Caenorhabditis remanei]